MGEKKGRKKDQVTPRVQVWEGNRAVNGLKKTGGAVGLGFSACQHQELKQQRPVESMSFEARDQESSPLLSLPLKSHVV